MKGKIVNINLEAQLWKSIKKGDLSALGELYDCYVDDLFAYGIKIASDKTTVMDTIHDLFLDLYKYHNKLAEVKNVKGYIFKSFKRALHKRKNPNVLFIGEPDYSIIPLNNNTHTKSWEEELITLENTIKKNTKVKNALSLLSKNQQRILALRFKEDKSYEEIATEFNISIESARTNIYRSLKQLRASIFSLLFFIF